MKRLFAVFLVTLVLSGCKSGVNFEFSTSNYDEECMRENPSHACTVEKN